MTCDDLSPGEHEICVEADDGKAPPVRVCNDTVLVILEESDGDGARPTGETLTLDLGGGVTMELVRIPAGSFMMGSENGDYNETPVHSVTITQNFYIGRYEVTQAQWERVMGTTPWAGRLHVLEQGDCPATYVSWEDAVQFCQTLSASTGYDIRLPTEAEWEYTCRAESTTEYYFGNDPGDLGAYAWYYDNACHVGEGYAHPVGQKIPNDWGLYDMHGNVWEWCNDWYDANYYSALPSRDPQGPSSGTEHRVMRGGSWRYIPSVCRSANRSAGWPDYTAFNYGFRCALGT